MRKSHLLGALCACIFCVISMSSHAAPVSGQGTWETTLKGRDLDGNAATFEAYYDTVLNITWLADASYAGGGDWTSANNGVNILDPYSSGITGWRLPTVIDTGSSGCDNAFSGTDCGYNVDTATGEMASLFYDTLGNLAQFDTSGNELQSGYGLSNTGPFSNIHSPFFYWTGTLYALSITEFAWEFEFGNGNQDRNGKYITGFVWAVHDGDVGTAVVPLPAAAWLFGAGLLGLAGLARRKAS